MQRASRAGRLYTGPCPFCADGGDDRFHVWVVQHEAKEPGRDYLLVEGPLASELNAIGVLFGLIFRAAGK
jgi:hypothetical protein